METPIASTHRRRPWLLVAVVAVLAVVASACGGGGGSTPSAGASTPAGSGSAGASAGTPKVGGTLTFAEFSPPVGMDPILETGAGVTGLIELTAVYDTLLRYNYDTGKYDPGTAESATPNADATEWTIKLRPNVMFTDGTPLNADAVVFGLNRFRVGSPGAPSCQQLIACPRPSTINIGPYVKDITAVDPLTVKVSLTEPWGSFPVILAAEPGLIPSPTALKKCDGNAPVTQCAFNTAPVGAGPFMLTSYKPGEAITMVRNPNYWGGPAYLDGLRFITYNDGGGLKSLDALQSGAVQMAFLRDPAAVTAAKDAKTPGRTDRTYVGSTVLGFNVGSATAASHYLQVRQAVAAAVDPNVINQRVFDGKTQATTQLLTSTFKWYPDVPGPKYDPAAAKQLVAEAKAAGWDGKISILASNTPAQVTESLALQAMLENVGMAVTLDNTGDVSATTAKYVKGDFDVWVGGYGVFSDDWSVMALSTPMLSTSSGNRLGIKDPKLDADFAQLFAASTDAEKTAAWKSISLEINAQMPILSLGTIDLLLAQSDKVHGVGYNVRTSVHLDKAWIG